MIILKRLLIIKFAKQGHIYCSLFLLLNYMLGVSGCTPPVPLRVLTLEQMQPLDEMAEISVQGSCLD
ncbi:MAG: hypothetical protein KDC53_18765, partial [Saprospiraceae bacterium]|nr:hypothetical protein [Saprospiraceae bacterium]